MAKLDTSIDRLAQAVDLLEEQAAGVLALHRRRPSARRKLGQDDFGSLFSPQELSTVKARLDQAIERLENVLEDADATA